MTVQTKYYEGVPGSNYISDPELFNAVILKVAREGRGFKFTSGDGGVSVSPEGFPGFVYFTIPFAGDETIFTRGSFEGSETIMIKFKS